jgi:hypothetical protein
MLKEQITMMKGQMKKKYNLKKGQKIIHFLYKSKVIKKRSQQSL